MAAIPDDQLRLDKVVKSGHDWGLLGRVGRCSQFIDARELMTIFF